MALNPDHLRAYLDRPWGLLEQIRDRAWGEETRCSGPARAISLSWLLREQLSSLHPDWPTEEDRRQDLADHVRFREIIGRAGQVLRARDVGR